jgi:hypothetical protein
MARTPILCTGSPSRRALQRNTSASPPACCDLKKLVHQVTSAAAEQSVNGKMKIGVHDASVLP